MLQVFNEVLGSRAVHVFFSGPLASTLCVDMALFLGVAVWWIRGADRLPAHPPQNTRGRRFLGASRLATKKGPKGPFFIRCYTFL